MENKLEQIHLPCKDSKHNRLDSNIHHKQIHKSKDERNETSLVPSMFVVCPMIKRRYLDFKPVKTFVTKRKVVKLLQFGQVCFNASTSRSKRAACQQCLQCCACKVSRLGKTFANYLSTLPGITQQTNQRSC